MVTVVEDVGNMYGCSCTIAHVIDLCYGGVGRTGPRRSVSTTPCRGRMDGRRRFLKEVREY
jgi:hypothetical protein